MRGATVLFSLFTKFPIDSRWILYHTVITDSEGRASVGEWILPAQAGTNVLRASISGATPVEFTAVGDVDVPAAITAMENEGGLSGLAGTPSGTLSARVSDRFNNGIPGVDVEFTVESGNGAVASATARTDARGVAVSGIWTLGAAGTNTASATAADGLTAQFSRTALQGGGTLGVYYLITKSGLDPAAFGVKGASYTLTDNGTFLWTRTLLGDGGPEVVYSEAGKFSDTQWGLEFEVQNLPWTGTLIGDTLTLVFWDDDGGSYTDVYRK